MNASKMHINIAKTFDSSYNNVAFYARFSVPAVQCTLLLTLIDNNVGLKRESCWQKETYERMKGRYVLHPKDYNKDSKLLFGLTALNVPLIRAPRSDGTEKEQVGHEKVTVFYCFSYCKSPHKEASRLFFELTNAIIRNFIAQILCSIRKSHCTEHISRNFWNALIGFAKKKSNICSTFSIECLQVSRFRSNSHNKNILFASWIRRDISTR